MRRVARQAVEVALAGERLRRNGGVVLVPQEPVNAEWASVVEIDPFAVPIAEKVAILRRAAEIMLAVPEIRKAYGYMEFIREEKWLATSEGSFIHTQVALADAAITAQAIDAHDARTRTYPLEPASHGFETVLAADLPGHAAQVAEEAVELLHAPPCPSGIYDLVLDPAHLSLTIHESVGHATELDRVLGMEESNAGKSFATLDRRGSLRYGSPLVNFVADNTLPGGLATTGFDDDAVPCGRWEIIRNGILVGYTTNRETAAAIGETRSRGGNRADSWMNIPIIRQPNLCLLPSPQPVTPEELIGGVDHGFLVVGRGSYSIDQRRINFQFGGDVVWEIRHGRRAGMVKNFVYGAKTVDFWNHCDGLSGADYWRTYGITDCGKCDPGQRARMTHAAPYARFRGIRVGGVRP